MAALIVARFAKWLERDLSTWKVLLVLLLGAGFGLFVLFAGFHGWDDGHRDFAGMSPFVLWAGLMCAQTALWALALAWLVPSIVALWQDGDKQDRTEIVPSTIALVVAIAVLVVPSAAINNWPNYLPHHEWKLTFLTLIGVLVGLVAAWGVWLVHGQLKRLARQEHLANQRTLDKFLGLRGDVQRFLGTLGAILGLLILATGAQRQVVLAYVEYTPAKDPIDYGYQLVLVYGFFFSILVATVYIPTHLTFASVGSRIQDACFPALSPTSPLWEERTAKRERLGSVLGLQVGPLSQFKTSAAILTPLVGSLIGLVLK